MLKFQNIFYKPFPGNSEVKRMIRLDGEIYIAAGGSTPNILNIYWLDHAGCKIWRNITPNWKPSPGTSDLAMMGFQGKLYIGTDAGRIYRIAPKTWTISSPIQLQRPISSMVVFNGNLYAKSGRSLHSTSDGIKWDDLGTIPVLDQHKSSDTGLLASFKGHLYFGVGIKKYASPAHLKQIAQGIEIWRSADGKKWSLFKEIIQDLTNPYILIPAPQHVHAMKEFNGYLYIGEYEGEDGYVFRTDGSPNSWEKYPVLLHSGNILALEVHDGKLYAGLYRLKGGTAGDHLLYRTSNGKTWSVVPGSKVGTAQTLGIVSMVSADGKLYVGTGDTGEGGKVYEMGDPVSVCRAADIYRKSDQLIRRLELEIRDLSEAKLTIGAGSTKETLQDLEQALVELRATVSAQPDTEKALGYLQMVQRELDTLSYHTDLAGSLEAEEQQVALQHAAEYGERALNGYQLYLAVLKDFEEGIGERLRRD